MQILKSLCSDLHHLISREMKMEMIARMIGIMFASMMMSMLRMMIVQERLCPNHAKYI